MKRILGSILVVLGGVWLVGCGGDNPGGIELQRRQFLGLWREANMESLGLRTGCPGTLQLNNGMIVACGGSLEFRSDTTFTQRIDLFDGTQLIRTGTWTIVRNVMTLYFNDLPDGNAGQPREQFTVILGEDGNSFRITKMYGNFPVNTLLVRQTF